MSCNWLSSASGPLIYICSSCVQTAGKYSPKYSSKTTILHILCSNVLLSWVGIRGWAKVRESLTQILYLPSVTPKACCHACGLKTTMSRLLTPVFQFLTPSRNKRRENTRLNTPRKRRFCISFVSNVLLSWVGIRGWAKVRESLTQILYLPSVTPKAWLSRLRMKTRCHAYSRLCSNFSRVVETLEPLQHW